MVKNFYDIFVILTYLQNINICEYDPCHSNNLSQILNKNVESDKNVYFILNFPVKFLLQNFS